MKKQLFALCLAFMAACFLTGCARQTGGTTQGEKRFVYGTTGYGVEMGDAGLNPHDNYSGWSAVRYGVGETLFKFSDSMEPESWLATDYAFTDAGTLVINLRDDVDFTSSRHMDGEAVKECLEHLLAVHDRAPGDLKISRIDVTGKYQITIHTSEPTPALIHYLCDPYGAIIDMNEYKSGTKTVAGTGPYRAIAVSDTEITLVKNDAYWGGRPKVDTIVVKSITDGDALTAALQSGDIDAAYGIPYASYELFENDRYTISSTATSRVFFIQMNFQSAALQDDKVRKAIAMTIDKQGFVSVLLAGHGAAAAGAFPDSFSFGNQTVAAERFNIEGAKALLAAAGYQDADGDGYVEKNGAPLELRYLTYPGRQELPLLAESLQASLKEIGIKVHVNCTASHLRILETGAYDLYASALVTAPTGDPEYFFTTCALRSSAKNRGNYVNETLEALAVELHNAFEPEERAALATRMQQVLLDDHAFLFASHLKMSLVSRRGIKGLTAHPCDYYEITADLDVD